jgi:transcriptional regulator with XRE-family HTH domain
MTRLEGARTWGERGHGIAVMTLATTLFNLRQREGLTQLDLARRTRGVTPATISRIESGQIENPQRETLVQLAEALGVSVGVLLGEAEPSHEAALEALVRRIVVEEGADPAKADEIVTQFLQYVRLPYEVRRNIYLYARYLAQSEGLVPPPLNGATDVEGEVPQPVQESGPDPPAPRAGRRRGRAG